MSYDPFCSVDVRADIFNQNAIFSLFFRNTGYRSLQVNYVFLTKRPRVGGLKQAPKVCTLVITIYRYRNLDLAV